MSIVYNHLEEQDSAVFLSGFSEQYDLRLFEAAVDGEGIAGKRRVGALLLGDWHCRLNSHGCYMARLLRVWRIVTGREHRIHEEMPHHEQVRHAHIHTYRLHVEVDWRQRL